MTTKFAEAKGKLENELVQAESKLTEAIPATARKMLNVKQITSLVLTDFGTTPKLRECTLTSILGAVMECAQVGLPPGRALGLMYLIPRKNGKSGKMECHAEMGYKGVVAVACRPGLITNIEAEVVCENDYFEYELGTGKFLKHRPPWTNRGAVLGAYMLAWVRNQEKPQIEVMSLEQLEKVRKVSSYGNGGPWVQWTNEMYRKTVTNRGGKRLPAWAFPPEYFMQMQRENQREFPQYADGIAMEANTGDRMNRLEHDLDEAKSDELPESLREPSAAKELAEKGQEPIIPPGDPPEDLF